MLKPLLMFETSPNVSTSPNVVSHGDAVILHHHGFYFLVSQPLHQKKLLQMFFLIQQSCWKNMLWICRFTQIGGICANCLFLYLCIIDQPFIYDCELLSVELDQMLANYSTVDKWWHKATQIVNCAVQLWEKSQYQEVTEGQYSQWPFCRNVTKISFWNGNPCPWQSLHYPSRVLTPKCRPLALAPLPHLALLPHHHHGSSCPPGLPQLLNLCPSPPHS